MFIKGTLLVFLLGLLLVGCVAQPAAPAAASTVTLAPSEISPTLPAATVTPTVASTVAPTAQDSSAACNLAPVVVPTLPAKIPGYTELDETTGLHVTGTYQQIDLATYHLKISGLVDHPLSLTYDELRCLPRVTDNPPLVCPGVFRDMASWSGVPIKDVLKLAGVQSQASTLILVSADGYRTSLTLEEALKPENFLAYELEGKPLPVLHGFPLRAVFPGQPGSMWAKWVVGIEID